MPNSTLLESLRDDIRGSPALLASRATVLPLLVVAASAVVLVLAVQLAPAGTGLPGASAEAATVSGSPLGLIASIMALLFLGIPSPPAWGVIILASLLARRSSWLAGGIAGFLGSMGALAAVIAISPNQAGESIAVFAQILATSVVFGLVIGGAIDAIRGFVRRVGSTSGVSPNAATVGWTPPAGAQTPLTRGASVASNVATLTSLAELRDRGVITSEEFEVKKAEVLSRM